jgi:hypothetical protein
LALRTRGGSSADPHADDAEGFEQAAEDPLANLNQGMHMPDDSEDDLEGEIGEDATENEQTADDDTQGGHESVEEEDAMQDGNETGVGTDIVATYESTYADYESSDSERVDENGMPYNANFTLGNERWVPTCWFQPTNTVV